MSNNLPRIQQKIFAKNATAETRTSAQFGSVIAGDPLFTGDIETIQALSNWEDGWIGSTITNRRYPTSEETTGINKVITQQLAYLLQKGLPEWDPSTTYYSNNCWCQRGGKIFLSTADGNIGNDPLISPQYWVEKFEDGSEGNPKYEIGDLVFRALPSSDAGKHLLDGSVISGEGSASQFVDYIKKLYNKSLQLSTWGYSLAVPDDTSIIFNSMTEVNDSLFVACGPNGKMGTWQASGSIYMQTWGVGDPSITWNKVSRVPGYSDSTNYYDLVAVGSNGYLASVNRTSVSDGPAWITSRWGVVGWNDIAFKHYTNSRITVVIVGEGGNIRCTIADVTDTPASWDLSQTIIVNPAGTTVNWKRVIYADGRFVAIGGNYITTSVDGTTWTTPVQITSNNITWNDIIYFNNKFIIAGTNGNIALSTDLTSWSTPLQIAPSVQWNAMTSAAGGSLLVVVGTEGASAYSSDGLTWTLSNVTYADYQQTTVTAGSYTQSIGGVTRTFYIVASMGARTGTGGWKGSVETINSASYFTYERAWQTEVTTYGSCGKFVYNAEEHTVRLPKVSDIIQGTTDMTALGTLTEAGLPNLTGSFAIDNTSWLDGALFRMDGQNSSGATGSSGVQDKCVFDASNYNPIYGNSTTVQPQTVRGLVYIVIANAVQTDVQIDINQVGVDLYNKADRDLSNLSTVGHGVIDGPWMGGYLQMSTARAVGVYNINLSSYLPNDNYNYEVYFFAHMYSSSSTYSKVYVKTSILSTAGETSGIRIGYIGTNSRQGVTNTILPIGTDRILTITIADRALDGSDTGFCLAGYHRLGTNS